ncbi:MAG: hypothetical protein P4M11_02210 [Candidatus Pacebacteria bacterium]|nr:hypothetical protein [Candidatus Paceibacterota bacterium]
MRSPVAGPQGVIDTLKEEQKKMLTPGASPGAASFIGSPNQSGKKKWQTKTPKEAKKLMPPTVPKKEEKKMEDLLWINPPTFQFFPTLVELTNLIINAAEGNI